jgi:hypothetical protein
MMESIHDSNLPDKQKEILLEKANRILEEELPVKRIHTSGSNGRD